MSPSKSFPRNFAPALPKMTRETIRSPPGPESYRWGWSAANRPTMTGRREEKRVQTLAAVLGRAERGVFIGLGGDRRPRLSGRAKLRGYCFVAVELENSQKHWSARMPACVE